MNHPYVAVSLVTPPHVFEAAMNAAFLAVAGKVSRIPAADMPVKFGNTCVVCGRAVRFEGATCRGCQALSRPGSVSKERREAVEKCAADGMTAPEAAQAIGWDVTLLRRFAIRNNIKFRRVRVSWK